MTDTYCELLIGCGRFRAKRLSDDKYPDWHELTTLDNNPDVEPDILYNLKILPLPFEDEVFNEVHAYEVLEHLYPQGDYESFFREFSEYHRILKPGGKIFITVPRPDSVWAFGDPSHTRVLPPEAFLFLNQQFYEDNLKQNSVISDFRHIWKKNFELVYHDSDEFVNYIVMRKVEHGTNDS